MLERWFIFFLERIVLTKPSHLSAHFLIVTVFSIHLVKVVNDLLLNLYFLFFYFFRLDFSVVA
jgi:hypothetical protein